MKHIEVVVGDATFMFADSDVSLADVAERVGAAAGPEFPLLAAKLDGRPVDLSARLTPSDTPFRVVFIDARSPEGLEILRHDASHVAAQAVQRIFGVNGRTGRRVPQGVGPSTDEGFYQDFDDEAVGVRINEEDLPEIEAMMRTIVGERNAFHRLEMTKAEASALFPDDPLKQEIIRGVADERVSVYDSQHGYVDLCRGPHGPGSHVLRHFALESCARVYWRGDSKNRQLTRISGTAFATAEELDIYLKRREQAARRDHRRLGSQMKLFLLSEYAPGSAIWLPRGLAMREALIAQKRVLLRKYGFEEVITPPMMRRELWETSGHWSYYKENMFLVAPGDAKPENAGQPEFALKPMNCPGHVLIYKSESRSYRDLPLRIAEFGTVHRNELSGVLSGLLRVRVFTQDDAHLFVQPEQLHGEVAALIRMYQEFYALFAFGQVRIVLSTRPAERMGSDEDWDAAERALSGALDALQIAWELKPGDGAFYGPKIDFHIADCIGRSWQCGTIQVDFQLPQRFDLSYVARDGSRHRPIMIHPATAGSLERFTGVLIEHFEGRFPTWLAPVQVALLPVSEKALDYAGRVASRLDAVGIRFVTDRSDERLGKKILEAQALRAPYILVIGAKEAAQECVSVRDREGHEQRGVSLGRFIEQVLAEVAEKRTTPLLADEFNPANDLLPALEKEAAG